MNLLSHLDWKQSVKGTEQIEKGDSRRISAHNVVRGPKDNVFQRTPSDFIGAELSSVLRCRIDHHDYSFATDDVGAENTSWQINCCATEYVNDKV